MNPCDPKKYSMTFLGLLAVNGSRKTASQELMLCAARAGVIPICRVNQKIVGNIPEVLLAMEQAINQENRKY